MKINVFFLAVCLASSQLSVVQANEEASRRMKILLDQSSDCILRYAPQAIDQGADLKTTQAHVWRSCSGLFGAAYAAETAAKGEIPNDAAGEIKYRAFSDQATQKVYRAFKEN